MVSEQREISKFQYEMTEGTEHKTTRSERLLTMENALEGIPVDRLSTRHYIHKDGSYEVNEIYSKEQIQRYTLCTGLKNMFFPFQDLENRTIYEDCMNVNPFLASSFPAIYLLFALTGLFILLLVVLAGFIVLLFIILNLTLV